MADTARHTLFPHQETALARIRDNPRPALFMEMRLGKTPVVIRWAKEQIWHTPSHPDRPHRILTIAPVSTLDDWAEELRRERVRPIIPLYNMARTEREELMWGGTGWYLINYEGVRILPEIADLPWDVVIADESTRIRNPSAKITKLMTSRFADVPFRAILSGEPRPESDLDYFSQFVFLHGMFMNHQNYWVFRNAHFNQNRFAKWDWTPKPGMRDAVKQYVHARAVVMTKKQVKIGGTFAPIQRRMVEQNDAQQRALKELSKKYAFEYIETKFATVRDVWMARVAGGFSPDRENPELLSNAKTVELVELLKGELAHEQVVVWFRFNEELEHVVNWLNQKAKIPTVGVTGATAVPERKDIRNRFAAGKFRVICVQIQLGKYGWDLSAARTAIRYSNAYDYESYSQSRERIVHPLKKDPLLELHLVTRNSLDEDVFDALKKKKRDSRMFMRELNTAFLERIRRSFGGQDPSLQTAPREVQNQKVRRVYPGSS